MIHLDNITLVYGGQPVLRSCAIQMQPGERVALMGPSGCGKTSLLNIIAGLQEGSGTAEVNGTVSYAFQEPALFPWLTAVENINVVLRDSAASLPRAEKWLAAVGLADCAGKYPHQLSGGQKQRVAIARALAFGGDILLLDEPFKGLDEDTRRRVAALIDEAWQGRTLLLATHDPQEAELLECRVLQYHDGKFA